MAMMKPARSVGSYRSHRTHVPKEGCFRYPTPVVELHASLSSSLLTRDYSGTICCTS